jgi:hypothetical protein
MRPEDWKMKNMLHRIRGQLYREEMLKGISDEFNTKFIFQLDTLAPEQFAKAVERMRGTR